MKSFLFLCFLLGLSILPKAHAATSSVVVNDFLTNAEAFTADSAAVASPDGVFVTAENAPGSQGGAVQFNPNGTGAADMRRTEGQEFQWAGFDSFSMMVKVPATYTGSVTVDARLQAGGSWTFVVGDPVTYANDGQWHVATITKAQLEASAGGGWNHIRSYGLRVLLDSSYTGPIYLDHATLETALPIHYAWDFPGPEITPWQMNTGYPGASGFAWANAMNAPGSMGGAIEGTCTYEGFYANAVVQNLFGSPGVDMTGTQTVGMYVKVDSTFLASDHMQFRIHEQSGGWKFRNNPGMIKLYPDVWTLVMMPTSLAYSVADMNGIEACFATEFAFTGKIYVDRIFLVGDSPYTASLPTPTPGPSVNSVNASWVMY